MPTKRPHPPMSSEDAASAEHAPPRLRASQGRAAIRPRTSSSEELDLIHSIGQSTNSSELDLSLSIGQSGSPPRAFTGPTTARVDLDPDPPSISSQIHEEKNLETVAREVFDNAFQENIRPICCFLQSIAKKFESLTRQVQGRAAVQPGTSSSDELDLIHSIGQSWNSSELNLSLSIGQSGSSPRAFTGPTTASVPPSISSQIREEKNLETVAREVFDNSFQKNLHPIRCSLESLARKFESLTGEVEQIKLSNPNHHANERYRSEPNQEYAAIVEEENQEKTDHVGSEALEDEAVQLRFVNKLKPLVYAGHKITAQDGMAVDIAIYRDNQIVTSGPLSYARIEILALHGDSLNVLPYKWSENQFDKCIVVSSLQGSVLGGVCQVNLKNGVSSLVDVSFKMPSSNYPSRKFILAARVHKSDRAGLRIKEAVMDPVEVQVSRNECNAKSTFPKLTEEIHRIKGISRNGKVFNRLKQKNICTVMDLLKAINKDEENICTECFKQNKDNKSWKATVKHAKECDFEGNCQLKSYTVDQNVVLFFNCVYDLVGAEFNRKYVIKDKFNSDQQDAVNCLKKQAYDELDSISVSHEMKDNYPVPLSTTLNTRLSSDACIPFTDTSGANPSDLHITSQVQGTEAVEPAHGAEINHAHGLPHAFLNNGAGAIIPEPSFGCQGNQASALTQMALQFSQVAPVCTGSTVITAGTPPGGNASIRTNNAPQNPMCESLLEDTSRAVESLAIKCIGKFWNRSMIPSSSIQI